MTVQSIYEENLISFYQCTALAAAFFQLCKLLATAVTNAENVTTGAVKFVKIWMLYRRGSMASLR
jgi:hypothetical protein